MRMEKGGRKADKRAEIMEKIWGIMEKRGRRIMREKKIQRT